LTRTHAIGTRSAQGNHQDRSTIEWREASAYLGQFLKPWRGLFAATAKIMEIGSILASVGE
jgi:hypothetical protein